jgi:hypothetical protein
MAGAAVIYPADDGLVYVYVAVPDFQVIAAFRAGTHPCLVVNSGPLTAEVRQGHQVSLLALEAFGKIELFHKATSQPICNF